MEHNYRFLNQKIQSQFIYLDQSIIQYQTIRPVSYGSQVQVRGRPAFIFRYYHPIAFRSCSPSFIVRRPMVQSQIASPYFFQNQSTIYPRMPSSQVVIKHNNSINIRRNFSNQMSSITMQNIQQRSKIFVQQNSSNQTPEVSAQKPSTENKLVNETLIEQTPGGGQSRKSQPSEANIEQVMPDTRKLSSEIFNSQGNQTKQSNSVLFLSLSDLNTYETNDFNPLSKSTTGKKSEQNQIPQSSNIKQSSIKEDKDNRSSVTVTEPSFAELPIELQTLLQKMKNNPKMKKEELLAIIEKIQAYELTHDLPEDFQEKLQKQLTQEQRMHVTHYLQIDLRRKKKTKKPNPQLSIQINKPVQPQKEIKTISFSLGKKSKSQRSQAPSKTMNTKALSKTMNTKAPSKTMNTQAPSKTMNTQKTKVISQATASVKSQTQKSNKNH